MNYSVNNKKKIKKLFVLFLATVFIITSYSFVFSAEKETKYSFLEYLEAVPEGKESGDAITKGEFAFMVANTFYKDIAETHSSLPFLDVSENHKYLKAISLLKGLKVVNGDTYGNYYPELDITPAQAVTILMRTLNYTQYAESMGGYPSGYFYIAKTSGITNNIDLSGGKITLEVASELIYNALFSNIVVLDTIKDGEPYYTIDPSVKAITAHLGITRVDGVLVADNKTYVSGSNTVGLNQVKIKATDDGKVYTYYCEDDSISSFMGMRINAYVYLDKKSDEETIVYFEKHNNVKITEILTDDILTVRNTTIEYQTAPDASKSKTISFSKNDTIVVLNGVKTADYSSKDLKPKYGKIVFIDNDNNGRAEYVFVYEYNSLIVVDRISEDDGIIMSRLSATDNLDVSEDSDINYLALKDNKYISFDDIKTDDIINVAKSERKIDGKYLCYMFVSSVRESGVLTSVASDDNKLYMGDDEYRVSKLLIDKYKPNLFGTIQINSKLTVYIDCDGRIAYIDNDTSLGMYYYLINMYKENTFDSEIRLKIYTDSAVFSEPVISRNVVIDGKRLDGKLRNGTGADTYSEIRELLNVRPDTRDYDDVSYLDAETAASLNKTLTAFPPRPAKLRFNAKGEVISIDTDAKNYASAYDEAMNPETLKPGRRDLRRSRFSSTNQTVDGSYFITKDTVILKVADIDRYNLSASYVAEVANLYEQDLYDINSYRVMRMDQNDFDASGYVYYDAQAYDIDDDTGVAGLVILRGYNKYWGSASTQLAVYDRMTTVYDSLRECEMPKIYYYLNGKEESVIVDKERLHPYVEVAVFGNGSDIPPLKQGDIIGVLKDSEGYLSVLMKDLAINEINSKNSSTLRAAVSEGAGYTTNNSQDVYALQPPTKAQPIITSSTYSMILGVVDKLNGNVAKLLIPFVYSSGIEVGTTFDNIYTIDKSEAFAKYVRLGVSSKFTVVEEIKCNSQSHNDCEFKIREGNINDIKPVNSFSENGIYNASRIFFYTQYGSGTNLVIINLHATHDR